MKNLKFFRDIYELTQEQLAHKLNLDKQTIVQYESGQNKPLFKIFLKMIKVFNISFDFLILREGCLYLRNLKLIDLSKKLDELTKAEARNSIEYNAKSFLKEKINKKILTKFDDDIQIVLTDNFNSNLKKLRISQNLKQRELADSIGVSRALLAKYEENIYPPIEKVIKLSEIFNISIHALATGEKLILNFTDGHFGKIMLFADQLLPLEDHKILIKLMENIITQPTAS